MPVAIIVGGPPVVGFQGPQKLRLDVDELGVAGGLAGGPINLVRGRTVDLLVPAEAEIVVEGHVDPEYLEPEGPFGESHGYVALEDYNLVIEVSAITRRRDAIMTSIISQVTPSESSVVKRLAYEPLFMAHLHDHLGIAGIRRVALHEPLTNLRRFVFLQFARFTPRTEIWRGAARRADAAGRNREICYRDRRGHRPRQCRFRFLGHVLSLQPGRGHADRARPRAGARAADRGQPASRRGDADRRDDEAADAAAGAPQARVHGERQEALGTAGAAGADAADAMVWLLARRLDGRMGPATRMQATKGEWMARDGSYRQRRRRDVEPNSPVRPVEEKDED